MVNPWTTHAAEYDATLKRVTSIAENAGHVLNPDQNRVMKVVGLMTENFVSTGKHFCPCKQSHPLNPETDVICPCPTWQDEIAADGHCFCRLFYRSVARRSE